MQLGEGYGHTTVLVNEMGMLVFPIKNLGFGLHICNLIKKQISDEQGVRLPTRVSMGASYQMVDHLFWNIEAEKILEEETTRWKMGISFGLYEHFSIRAGVQSRPFSQSLGFGSSWKPWHFDLAFSRLDPLGYTTQISVQYGM